MHALIAIAAAQAGKDVYVEKPASHDIWEGRQMVQAARQNNRIMQCGTQSRSSTSLKEAVAFVHGGELGKIQYALGTCYKPRPSIGKLDKPLAIPSTIDYDLWCGPAAKEDLYRPNLHYDWHWDFNTGNGDMGNQGIHQMDIARWFLGEDALAPRVISIGGRLGYEDAGNTPNTQIVYLDYPSRPADLRDPRPAPLESGPKALGRQHGPLPRLADRRDRPVREAATCSCPATSRRSPTTTKATRSSTGKSPDDALGYHIQQLPLGRRRERSVAAQRRHPGRPPLQLALPPGRHFAPARQAGPRRRNRGADQGQRAA